jgi:hypothetical protein
MPHEVEAKVYRSWSGAVLVLEKPSEVRHPEHATFVLPIRVYPVRDYYRGNTLD